MEELTAIKTAEGREFKPWASKETVQEVVLEAVQDPASITAIASEIASGKQAIASAISAKGGTADPLASFQQLAQDIRDLPDFNNIIKLWAINVSGIYDKTAAQGLDENELYDSDTIDDSVVPFNYTIKSSYLYQYWQNLTTVRLSKVSSISSSSLFKYCFNLKIIELPNLTTIAGGSIFANCSALVSIVLDKIETFNVSSCFSGCSVLNSVSFPLLREMTGQYIFSNCGNLQYFLAPSLAEVNSGGIFYGCTLLINIEFGKLTAINANWSLDNFKILRNISIGQDTNINLPFQQWTAANVIAEGQSGINELNTNLYNNLLTKLYDHSQDGQTRTLRIGWLANVSAENIAYANAKGWTLTT